MTREDDQHLSVPSLEEDSAERRRLLNVLAQRRYRRRKREQMQDLKAQVQKRNQEHEQTSLLAPTPDSLNSSNVDICQTEPFVFDIDLLSSTEPLSGTDEILPIDFNDYLPSADAPSSIADFWVGDYGSAALTPDDTVRSNPAGTSGVTSSAVSREKARSGFADYLVTTPGLSVIRAHAEIFDRLVGPSYDLDIFNPASVSPISLGVQVQPDQLVAHYRPTPLQRSVQHHPIIDVLPWPSFRDRFLYIMSLQKERRPKIARQDMPAVTLELMLAVKDAGGGIRVWGHNSFCPDSWEIGQVFYSKFWWAIDEEIVRASNRHRLLRGENKLNTNLLSY